MKQTWFRPPAYRQFSLDADATDAPNRPDGTVARRLDGNPPTQDSMRGQAPAQPGAGQAEQHGLERVMSERQEQPIAEQSTPDPCAQPAIGQRADCQDSTARPDARRGATKQGLRSARRRIERALDR